ncbi:hypothetical protein LY76DRAFT_529529, partial [Colletotrichum caudatum]
IDDKLQLFCSVVIGDRRAINKQSEIQRVAIAHIVLAGRTHKKGADVFGCSQAAVTETFQQLNNT